MSARVSFASSVEDGLMHIKINAKYICQLLKKHNTYYIEIAFDAENFDYFVINNKRDYDIFTTKERRFICFITEDGPARGLYKGFFNGKEQFIIVETFLKD